jgi:hypothetical protein
MESKTARDVLETQFVNKYQAIWLAKLPSDDHTSFDLRKSRKRSREGRSGSLFMYVYTCSDGSRIQEWGGAGRLTLKFTVSLVKDMFCKPSIFAKYKYKYKYKRVQLARERNGGKPHKQTFPRLKSHEQVIYRKSCITWTGSDMLGWHGENKTVFMPRIHTMVFTQHVFHALWKKFEKHTLK